MNIDYFDWRTSLFNKSTVQQLNNSTFKPQHSKLSTAGAEMYRRFFLIFKWLWPAMNGMNPLSRAIGSFGRYLFLLYFCKTENRYV
ncbi:MAG: hypothetical protein LBG31_05990 [Prevotellaceae bacterium]|nr:hypothetical protein [Prevotellaceae bacterium]